MSPPRSSRREKPAATSLSVRSNRLTLPEAAEGERFVTEWKHAFSTEADASASRVVQLSSTTGPFEVELQWSSGEGIGNRLLVTVPFSTQVTLWAKTLIVKLRNLCGEPNSVTTTIDDGSVPSKNQYALVGSGYGEWDIPPHAKTIVPHLSDYSDEANIFLVLFDGKGNIRFRREISQLSEATGVPVGGAKKVRLEGAGETSFQLVCSLGM
jgi:hypothetical protein